MVIAFHEPLPGSSAFGGPATHIALMEQEVVRRRQWLTYQEFLDLLGATNLIPGPNSTEMAIHIGHRRAGWRGLLVAGVCFILPAFVFVALSGPLVPRLRSSQVAGHFLDGVNVASLALIGVVTWRLGSSALVDWPTVLLAFVAGFLLIRYRLNSIWLVLLGAAFGLCRYLL